MSNETPSITTATPPHNGGVWPPPMIRYVVRVIAFGLSVGAAGAAFSGQIALAGTLAAIAAALQLTDIIGGK
ncbi:MAG TPA: hypothetical protein VHG32_21535 [Thermoanaerobaculia bacterium]|nr:hypothetical protein [Thermoanaerobaculia bacterium]